MGAVLGVAFCGVSPSLCSRNHIAGTCGYASAGDTPDERATASFRRSPVGAAPCRAGVQASSHVRPLRVKSDAWTSVSCQVATKPKASLPPAATLAL